MAARRASPSPTSTSGTSTATTPRARSSASSPTPPPPAPRQSLGRPGPQQPDPPAETAAPLLVRRRPLPPLRRRVERGRRPPDPALLGFCSTFLVYGLARRLLGQRFAFPAALIYATTHFIPDEYRKVMADPYLAFFTCAALYAWFRAAATPRSSPLAPHPPIPSSRSSASTSSPPSASSPRAPPPHPPRHPHRPLPPPPPPPPPRHDLAASSRPRNTPGHRPPLAPGRLPPRPPRPRNRAASPSAR